MSSEVKEKLITIRMPFSLWQKMKEAAKRESVTPSDIVRGSLSATLDAPGEIVKRVEQREIESLAGRRTR